MPCYLTSMRTNNNIMLNMVDVWTHPERSAGQNAMQGSMGVTFGCFPHMFKEVLINQIKGIVPPGAVIEFSHLRWAYHKLYLTPALRC